MKTAIGDMDESPSVFERANRHQEQASYRWAVPTRRFARRGPVLPRPGSEAVLRLLEPRRRHDWALLAVIRDAYVGGGATRRVEAVARVLGLDGVNDEDVMHAGHELDRQLQTFRTRPVAQAYPYLAIDAVTQSVRDRGRVVNLAAVVAAGVAVTGKREVLAVEVENPKEPATWLKLLGGLHDRGAYGVRLVTAEAHPGIALAIAETFPAATFQRSRSGVIREMQDVVPESDRPALVAGLREVFRQDDRASAQRLLRRIQDGFSSNSELVDQLGHAEESILAFYDFPVRHRRRVNAVSCLSRARREIQRHCRLIGIFPSRQSLLRLCGVMLQEHHDEWLAGPRFVGPRRDERRAATGSLWSGLETDATNESRGMLRLVQAA